MITKIFGTTDQEKTVAALGSLSKSDSSALGAEPRDFKTEQCPSFSHPAFKKNQHYLANVLNSNIVVEMPKEQSTFNLAWASLALSQPRNGVSWFCLTELGGLRPH